MPTYEITAPDGKVLEITAPEGATQEQVLAYAQAQYKTTQQPKTPPKIGGSTDPTEGMSHAQRTAAGFGKSFVDNARGTAQAAVEALSIPFSNVANIYRTMGSQDVAHTLDAPARKAAQMRAQETERKELDAPLMRTGGGVAGNILGTLTQLAAPAYLARGSVSAPAFLPRTATGNAVQGGILGMIQPVGEEDSRAQNVAIGAAAGGVGSAVPQLIGSAYRSGRALFEPITRKGQERIVAQAIQRSATDPARLTAAAPSGIPGVSRTLAEETADPGIGLLQRQFTSQLADQAAGNNAARAQAIRQTFEGADDASITAISEARDKAANTALRGVTSVTGADASRLPAQITRIENAYTGRPAVQQAMRDVRELLLREVPEAERKKTALAALQGFLDSGRKSGADFDAARAAMTMVRRGEVPEATLTSQAGQEALAAARKAMRTERTTHDSVATLYNVRKSISDLIGGRFGGEKAYAQAATRELMAVRNALDRVISKAAPEFRDYLSNYTAQSRRMDQAKVGQTLLGMARQSADPNTTERTLGANALSRAANDPGGLVRTATRFGKAGESTLTPEQSGLLRMLGEDASRMDYAATGGRAVGSDTAQNLATRNILTTLAGGNRLANAALQSQPAQRLAALGEKTYGLLGVPERLQSVMVEALSNPARAREILSNLPGPDRSLVERALSQVGGRLGVGAVPALTE